MAPMISSALSGAIFGYAISIGLGITTWPSIAISLISAIGVLAAGSISGYLLLQTTILSIASFILVFIFRFTSVTRIEAETVQLMFISLLAISPLIAAIPKVRAPIKLFSSNPGSQLISSALFLFLVVFLRERMPAHAGYALSKLYGMEDNAGIASELSTSINLGFTTHVSGLGEFSNGIYLTAAGVTSWFGSSGSSSLISPYTHWNMTLLFLAWIPLSAIVAVIATGKRLRTAEITIAVITMSVLLALLIWPFIGFGHTSVISAGLFGVVLLGLTQNRKLAENHPIVFLLLIASLGFIIGNIWFPLMPWGAATVGLTLVGLLQLQFRRGKKKTFALLVFLFVVAAVSLLPRLLSLVSNNDTLIELVGATRSASQLLVIVWLLAAVAAVWAVSKGKQTPTLLGSNLFSLTLTALLASNIYLVLSGALSNLGSSGYGYGATKYLLTSIAFSIPALWMTSVFRKKHPRVLVAMVSGLAISFSVFVSQPDQNLVLSTGIVSVHPVSEIPAEAKVVSAISEAIDSKTDHILCVSDLGQPMPVEGSQWNDYQWEAYLCTRWADSLSGNASNEGFMWRSTMINSMPEETLAQVRDTYKDKKISIIRFDYQESDPDTSAEEEIWWQKYVDPSWEIVLVNNIEN